MQGVIFAIACGCYLRKLKERDGYGNIPKGYITEY
jgi:hypothetical protein